MLSPGDQVDRYVVERLLGVGGVAHVWQVRHVLLGRRYALKLLPPNTQAAEEQALLEEGKAQAHLEHPNILPIRDVFQVRGRLGLLMPLIEGPTLRALLHRWRLPEAEALALLRAVLAGLAYVHQHGMVHCDLKPENVLLQLMSSGIEPCIADFGLARPVATSTGGRVRRQVGTPGYIAPEQLFSEQGVDHRADLFSAGAILYEVVTGQRLFPGETLHSARERVLPPDLSLLPEPLRPLAADLLQARPEDRPPDCAAVLARLPDVEPGALSPHSACYQRAAQLRLPSAGVVSQSSSSSSGSVPHNLVRLPDRFLGRAAALLEVSERLARGVRLISLLGIGGIGKSRLAHEVLRTVMPQFSGGVWLCELSGLTTRTELFSALAQALQIELEADPVDRIAEALASRRRTLLCLDGVEGLGEEAGAALSVWLRAVPEACFLVTSRIPLQLFEESRLLLEPLSAADGQALFLQRAQALGASLDLEQDAAAVQALVAYLDGLPLAITLAASRAALVSPARLLQRLQVQPELLRGSSAAVPERQRSLQDVLAWSWDSIPPPAQRVLAQLSLLEGSFSLSMAEAVVALPDVDPPVWLEDLLSELLDAGLLQVLLRPHQERRLQILPTVRRFARSHLSEEDAARAEDRLIQVSRRYTLSEALVEQAHIQRAALLAIARQPAASAWLLVHRAHFLHMRLGPYQEALALLDRIAPGLEPDTLPHLELLGCRLQSVRRLGHYEEALALCHDLQVRAQRAGSMLHWEIATEQLPILLHDLGRSREAVDHIRAYLVQARTPEARHRARINLSNILRELGDYTEALACLDALSDETASLRRIGYLNRGAVEADLGNLIVALHLFNTGLHLSQEDSETRSMAIAHQNLCEVLVLLGRFSDADRHLREAVALEKTLGDRQLRASLLATTGILQHTRDLLEPAEQSLRECVDLYASLRSPTLLAIHRSELAMLRCERDPAAAVEPAQHALERALEQPSAYSTIIAARAAIVFTRFGSLAAADDALRRAPPPRNIQARILLSMARAQLVQRRGFPLKAQQHLQEAATALLASELSPHGPLGRLFGLLFPDYPLQVVSAYTPTER